MKLIKQNISQPTLIITDEQTHGRGRIGKKWISKKEIFISIFLNLIRAGLISQFTFLNALLLKMYFQRLFQKIEIKWPNDLLYNNMKFYGILQEVIKFNDFEFLIVGIGLNTNVVPQNKSFKSTSLKNILKKN